MPNRESFTTKDIIHDIWTATGLPPEALTALDLPGADASPALPSSFKIGPLAQASIALSLSPRASSAPPGWTTAPCPQSACPSPTRPSSSNPTVYTRSAENETPPSRRYAQPHRRAAQQSDGHVRIHDVFPHHVQGTLKLLGLPADAARHHVAGKVARWRKTDLEEEGTERGKVAIYALRSYEEWDALPQSGAVDARPVLLEPIGGGNSTPKPMAPLAEGGKKLSFRAEGRRAHARHCRSRVWQNSCRSWCGRAVGDGAGSARLADVGYRSEQGEAQHSARHSQSAG